VTGRDPAASIRGRLERVARERGEDFQFTLIRFAIERWLHRLSRSVRRDRFVLKGAMLFEIWSRHRHRATRDLDLLGRGASDAISLRDTFEQICRTEVEPDGLVFDPDSIAFEELREGQDYPGQRLRMTVRLGNVRIPLAIDIAFGQAVTPAPEDAEYPSMLDLPTGRVLAYPQAVTIAEKFQAMVALGIANNRMKDFYDVAQLAEMFEHHEAQLAAALRATFERRRTPLPDVSPLSLTPEYFERPDRQADWRAFARRSGVETGTLEQACHRVAEFLMPVVERMRSGETPDRRWRPASGWKRLQGAARKDGS
jgi:hypothetical protein